MTETRDAELEQEFTLSEEIEFPLGMADVRATLKRADELREAAINIIASQEQIIDRLREALSSRAPQAGGEGHMCPQCEGTGKEYLGSMTSSDNPCPYCRGSGKTTPAAAPKGDVDWENKAADLTEELLEKAHWWFPSDVAMSRGMQIIAEHLAKAAAFSDAPKGDVRGALEPQMIEAGAHALWEDGARNEPTYMFPSREARYRAAKAVLKAVISTPSQDEGEALRSALYLANRDKESILRRLDGDIAAIEARPKSGEINETLRDGALGALRAFRAAIVEYEWTTPREYLTSTQKLEPPAQGGK